MSKIFSSKDSDMNKQEFMLAIEGLIDKGLVEEVIIDGERHYRLTEIGLMIGKHLDSNIKDQN